jgi:hypothetical protein
MKTFQEVVAEAVALAHPKRQTQFGGIGVIIPHTYRDGSSTVTRISSGDGADPNKPNGNPKVALAVGGAVALFAGIAAYRYHKK